MKIRSSTIPSNANVYRIVNKGELIEEGDQWLGPASRRWFSCSCIGFPCGEVYGSKVRRRVNPGLYVTKEMPDDKVRI